MDQQFVDFTKAASLRERVSILRKPTVNDRYFISYKSLKATVTRSLIIETLRQHGFEEQRIPDMATVIHTDGLRIFAILVLLGEERLIEHFIKYEEFDSKLPFDQCGVERISPLVPCRFWEEVQWELCPHTFRARIHRKIRQRAVLPYVEEAKIGEGAGGEIYKCAIAVEQQHFYSESQEKLDCLELLRHLRHSNIIELLGSYEYRDEYYLLFPVLSMDLGEFLARRERYGEFKRNKPFYRALYQLSSAIQAVHSLSISNGDVLIEKIGYHHDIRPQNILVTEETFVLTDFGLARFRMPDEGSETLWRETVGDYIAPECMTENYTRLEVGRSIDIWSLGCLVTEVATYMERGPNGVAEFAESRRTTRMPQLIENARYFEEEGLRTSADRWLVQLTTNPAIRGISSLIECARNMLQVDVEHRPKASVVTSQLEYIHTKETFREVHSLFEQLARRFDDRSLFALDRVTLSFYRDLFTAWGKFFGMYNDNFSHDFFEHRGDRRAIYTSLNDLERFLRGMLRQHGEDSVTVTNEAEQNGPGDSLSQGSSFETLGGFLRRLWVGVPEHYQRRIEQLWRQQAFSTEDVDVFDDLEIEMVVCPTSSLDTRIHAAMKRLTTEFERQDAGNDPRRQRLILNSFQVSRKEAFSQTHELGTLNSIEHVDTGVVPVVIEWVQHSPAWEGQTDEEKVLKMLSLAEILNLKKPETFHVLDCVGILPPSQELRHDGLAFVYAYPPRKAVKPESLERLLRRKDLKVLLEHKFSIAQVLTKSLLDLHSAEPSWLHKNIQAANVLFFPTKSGTTTSADIGDPYLIGFQHSRPNGEIWYSDMDKSEGSADYRDPRYLPGKTRFRKEFDYYSLGIVLLEIGFWQPIKAFRLQHSSFSAEELREELLNRYLPRLGPKMGSLYTEVVRYCLEGCRKVELGGEEHNVEDEFFWRVVDQLLKVGLAS